MMETFSISFTSDNEDGTSNISSMEVSEQYFTWNLVTEIFLRSLIAQGYVISKKSFIDFIDGQYGMFTWPDSCDDDEEEENAN
jgi:hypothetical protein